jgi:outer membrane receptor protein involved in Fe transport
MLRKRQAGRLESISAHHPSVHWLVGAVLTCISGLMLATSAVAEPTAVEFNIPAQPVSSALRAYARQARVQLLASTQGLDAIQANAVVGRFEPQTALHMLLAGTGLQAQYRADATVMVRRITKASVWPFGSMDSDAFSSLIAQANAEPDRQQAEESEAVLAEIVVVGTHLRGTRNDFSPVLSFDHAELDRSGFGSVDQFIESLPQNFGGGGVSTDTHSLSVGPGFGNVFQGSAINLRGLGPSSTLVLLNGRRMAPGGLDGQIVDISTIPLSALERVEVLTDGASAIYGSDAIAGVVNFVMRDDYDGAETRLRYGSVTNGGLDEVRLSQALGTSWDSGNVFLSFEYFHRSNLLTDERAFAGNSDLTSLGGTDNRPPGGNPANIIAGGDTFAIPAGQDGTSLTASDFTAGTQNVYNDAAGKDLFPEQERYSLFASLNQAISANAGLFVDGRFFTRETTTANTGGSLGLGAIDLTVPDTNPFFVDPTGTGLTSVRVDNYLLRDDFGSRKLIERTVDSVGGTAGIWLDFATSWQAEMSASYSKEEGSELFFNQLNLDALNAALASDVAETAFNPFGDGSNTSPGLLESLLVKGPIPGTFAAESELWSINLNVDGPLIQLPAGAIKFGGGMDYREEKIANTTTDGPVQGPRVTTPELDDDREVIAAYAEIFIPLIGEQYSRLGLSRLELSIAARYEDYSDFGSSTDPKVGLLWSPFAGLNFRSTYGTSFKAPLLVDLDPIATSSVFWFPVGGSLLLLGGNPDLMPEASTTWTAGIDYSPKSLSDLSLSLTYFDIDLKDQVDIPPNDLVFDFTNPQFADLVNEDPTQEEIAALVNLPFFRDVFGASAADLISGVVPTNQIIDARRNNIARSAVAGFETQISYQFETRAGQFSLGLNANYLIDFKNVFIDTLPLVEKVDTFQNPVDLRLRGSAAWRRGGWDVSTFVNHTDSYKNDTVDPVEEIDAWTTVDMQVSYNFTERDSNRWLDGVRLFASVQNIFDEDPPFVAASSNFGFTFGYDPTNADPLGRFFAFGLSKEW